MLSNRTQPSVFFIQIRYFYEGAVIYAGYTAAVWVVSGMVGEVNERKLDFYCNDSYLRTISGISPLHCILGREEIQDVATLSF
jgi:hypothetical protein